MYAELRGARVELVVGKIEREIRDNPTKVIDVVGWILYSPP